MRNRLTILAPLLTLIALAISGPLCADTVKGRIKSVSNKASTIQLQTGEPSVVRFDASTQFVNAASVKALGTNDLIEVEFAPGKPATRITKVVFELDPALQIDTAELERILAGERGAYTLIDARPAKPYLRGHIPTARNIFGKELAGRIDELPPARSAFIVFYCGGPTCPYTGRSIEVAQAHGFTNVKGYQIGIPAWKKAGKPVRAAPEWLANSLDDHHVILDVRSGEASSAGHLPGAVSMPAARFGELTAEFIKNRRPARLPGVADKAAPIVLVGDTDDGPDVLAAYAELKKWKYKNAAILEGGLASWTGPIETGPAASQIRYVRAPRPGAISGQAFAARERERADAFLLDVRTDKEAAAGTIEGTEHIPLDDLGDALARIPRDRPVLAYCSTGVRAEMAYEFLKSAGYTDVAFVDATVKVAANGQYSLDD